MILAYRLLPGDSFRADSQDEFTAPIQAVHHLAPGVMAVRAGSALVYLRSTHPVEVQR